MPRTPITQARTAITQPRQHIYHDFQAALQCNGSTTRVESTDAIDLTAYDKITFSCWLKQKVSQTAIIAEFSTNNNAVNDGFQFINVVGTGNTLQLSLHQSGGFSRWRTLPMRSGIWYHIAAVMDRTAPSNQATKIYVDGVLNGSNFEATSSLTGNFGNHKLFVGARSGGSLYATVDICDVRFIEGAIDADMAMRLAKIGQANGGELLLNGVYLDQTSYTNPETIAGFMGNSTWLVTAGATTTDTPFKARSVITQARNTVT